MVINDLFHKKYPGLFGLLNQYSKQITKFNIENYSRLVDRTTSGIVLDSTVNEIVKRQTELFKSFDSLLLLQPTTQTLIEQYWEVIGKISLSSKTLELENLKSALMKNDYSGIQAFINSLSASCIKVPNIALLKSSGLFNDLVSENLPRGLLSIVNKLHINTVQRMARSQKVCLDTKTKMFFGEGAQEDQVSVSESNILYSSLDLLSGIKEEELIVLQNRLSEYPEFAMENKTACEIKRIISNIDKTISFDEEYYYHGRALSDGACPYTKADLIKAPEGISWHGRFNSIGESHYYFSNKVHGARMEVAKHSDCAKIQVAKLKPIKPIKMFDISIERTTSKFLEYCRFNPSISDYKKVKREYLLPCFVAHCCKVSGIEGIKYYGSQVYTNYVSWQDSYFECVGFEIIDDKKIKSLSLD